MNAIALCHNRDLQKTNGRIIVLGYWLCFSDADSHLSEYATVRSQNGLSYTLTM